jgi:hypothetical protein
MAQSSTTISSQRDHKVNITGTDISFVASTKTISTTSTSLSNLALYDLVTVTGTSNNNKTFTVASVASNGRSITVQETVVNETADGSTTITIDYTGFVTAKFQGDGYYSQADGIHTVAYHVLSTLTGLIKMQGSLATTPTETDWFDITGTTFTTDQSTTIFSANFTGNFVWVRAKATGITAGSVTKILYNH